MELSALIFLKSARISLAAFPLTFVNGLVQKTLWKLILIPPKLVKHKTRVRIWLHLSYTELKGQCSKQEKRKRCGTPWTVAKREREAGRDVRARNAQSTFDKPLACVTGIFDHVFGKPLTWIADKFTYTFDPLLTASKGVSKEHLWYTIHRRSQVSKNGLYRLWSGWQRRI